MNTKGTVIIKKHDNNIVTLNETKHGIKILKPCVNRSISRNGVVQVQPC